MSVDRKVIEFFFFQVQVKVKVVKREPMMEMNHDEQVMEMRGLQVECLLLIPPNEGGAEENKELINEAHAIYHPLT